MSTQAKAKLPISPDLLEILRDPIAVRDKETYGDDPGQLELVHDCWLVSKDTGYKYPIKEGIPVMLVEEGQKWKDTPIEELPVPPGPLVPPTPAPQIPSGADLRSMPQRSNLLVYALGLGLLAGLILVIVQSLSSKKNKD